MNLDILSNGIKCALDPTPSILKHRLGEYYQPYYSLFEMLCCGFCVELGVEQGRGIIAMSYSAEIIIGIDNNRHPDIDSVLEKNLHFTFLHRDSLPPPNIIKISKRKINLLHIDTEHSYSMAKAEFEAYKPYLADGAIVCFDDLHAQEDSVLEYFNTLPYPKIQEDRLHPVCGYGVMIYEE